MAQRSKVHRSVTRHKQPCYCLYCEMESVEQWLARKNQHWKHPKKEIENRLSY